MKDWLLLDRLKRLEAAFRVQPLSPETIKIYSEFLIDIEDETFSHAVEEIIRNEDFFPSVRCLLKYCNAEPSYDAAGRRLSYV